MEITIRLFFLCFRQIFITVFVVLITFLVILLSNLIWVIVLYWQNRLALQTSILLLFDGDIWSITACIFRFS